jgi:hypothetical protein
MDSGSSIKNKLSITAIVLGIGGLAWWLVKKIA